jgi:hypothetical protein
MVSGVYSLGLVLLLKSQYIVLLIFPAVLDTVLDLVTVNSLRNAIVLRAVTETDINTHSRRAIRYAFFHLFPFLLFKQIFIFFGKGCGVTLLNYI